MATALIENKDVIERIKSIVEYANKPENYYNPEIEGHRPPGMRESHILHTGTMRVVYSITKSKGERYKHISVSNITNLPNPVAVWRVCQLFGFSCAPKRVDAKSGIMLEPDPSWQVAKHGEDNCIVVIEKIE